MKKRRLLASVFAVKREAMNLRKGVIVMVVVIVPLIALTALNDRQFAISVAFGALLVAFCDVKKSYPTRVRVLLAGTFVGACFFTAGRVIGPYPWLIVVPSIFLVTFFLGMCIAYGEVVAVVTALLNMISLLGLGISGGLRVAPVTLAGFVMGGLSITLLFLLPWPRPRAHYEPLSSTQAEQQGSKEASPSLLTPFLKHCQFRTPVSIFSLIKVLGVTLAAGISWGCSLVNPQWAPTMVLINTLPNPRMSSVVILQRVIGTLLGVLLAALLIVTLAKTVAFLLVVALALLIGFTVKDVNAGLSLFFMTIFTLILMSFTAPDDLSHAVIRFLQTVIGAGIACLVEGMLIWMSSRQKSVMSLTESAL
jgi:uncharacterized membrane protein YccC